MPKILVVDDLYQTRMIMRSFLTRFGYKVIDAKSGEEAIKFIIADPPDIIITDIFMPGMDGFDMIRQLRKNGFDIPIIVISANQNPISLDEAKKIEGIKTLTKPFKAKELIDAVEDLLRLMVS